MDFENQSTTSPWASRRRAIYLGALVLVFSAVSFGVFWKYWYSTPTCFDKTKNGDETGVDCGGSCTLICSGDVIKPIVRWDPRLFEVWPGLWSVLVYVENPNTDADAVYVPYSFIIYDEKNEILEKREGATILPKNKTVGIFEGSIKIEGKTKPRRTIFEFGNNIIWKKNKTPTPNITITSSPILRLDSAPRVEANVKNNGTEEVKNIELVDTLVQTGKTALFFELPEGRYAIDGSDVHSFDTVMGHYYFVSPTTGHALVQWAEPMDFKFWFNEQADVSAPPRFSGCVPPRRGPLSPLVLVAIPREWW